ncbi:hypothetical protein BAUCODRAFT_293834 [Baudoinia panamericana UAMH 10762]|uniref:Uncharacterized protein n=1 Tax=Baudoinia panamericana (strain UAMH 10762) TaxID=717646 RepID=M2MMB4_BAUPA|nr:uncharacterized protein BAUCODRAFT_293834 [Baudoinia panamericana UAMH 10762]EMC92498.1 hypothetical protein BAUCODRAFT_293834 [Baudoinia panamericana UAMH 10762]
MLAMLPTYSEYQIYLLSIVASGGIDITDVKSSLHPCSHCPVMARGACVARAFQRSISHSTTYDAQ